MSDKVKKFSEFVNEKEERVVYNTNFSGMVQGAIGAIYSQILAIAQDMANEKKARNPHRYAETEGLDEVDITRAINLIFHSDWKKLVKAKDVQEWAKKSVERANQHDARSDKKNQRSLRSMVTGKDEYKVDLGSMGHSRDSGSSGEGSNQ